MWAVGGLGVGGTAGGSGDGAGTLDITNGGHVVTSGQASVGENGSVQIDGPGSTWTSTFHLGFQGPLTVTRGGEVSAGSVGIFAAVSIDGPGSSLATTGRQTIGELSGNAGTLELTNGGQASSLEAVLLDGTVNVQGTGSKWSSDSLVLGFVAPADSMLNVTAGGELSTGIADLGGTFSGSSTVIVEADGSQWTNSGELDVGGLGSGAIVIRNSGKLRSGAMRVGKTGAGTLHVSSGAVVVVDDSIETASEPLSSGTITVEDEGSTLTASDLYVGGSASAAGGTGRIEIQDGSVNVDRLHVWESGDVQITGGTLNIDDTLTTSGDVEISGGAVNIDDTLTTSGDVEISGGAVNIGSTLTTSVDSKLIFSGGTLSVPSTTLQFAPQSFHWTGGTLHLVASDLTVGAGGLFGDSLALNARMNLQLDGALHVESGASLVAGGAVSAAGGVNDGTLSLIGGSLTHSQPAVNNGNLDALRATLSFPGDGIANEIGLTNQGVLTLADTTVNGDVHSPAGSSIQVAGGVVFNGLVSGGANFPGAGAVTFNDGYSPGDSPAAVAFGGDVTFGPNNALEIELAGTTPGAEYDQLLVADTASLDGILNVSLLGGFLPALGDSFTILTAAGGVAGTFADELLPALAAGLEWDVLYNPNDVTLAVLSIGPDCIFGDTGPCDGRVDIDDLNAVRNHFGATGGDDGSLAGDAFPFDGLVNIDDLNAVRNNFGATAAAVPEPSTCVLFCLCALFHLTAPRRR
jgi:T5SS/PEP-CTERM-associated repeat protein